MATCHDFVQLLSPDMSTNVLMHLDDPADLVRASLVSRDWRRFVIVNGFCKKLFSRFHPEAFEFLIVNETSVYESAEPCNDWETLEREHRVYALFLYLINFPTSSGNCIASSIAASSTDNFPEESIINTLESAERVNRRPSYWSSDGKKDPSISETLTYKLNSNMCIVEQINIRPFQAYFQPGHPIYSSKAVRFRMGHCLLPEETYDGDRHVISRGSSNDEYIWTYVSPAYPMEQINVLQSFKLPKPVICIGGIVQIELLGRIQKQEVDGLYYICVCHVQVIGRPVPPTFRVKFMNESKKFSLTYSPDRGSYGSNIVDGSGASGQSGSETVGSSGWHSFAERIRLLRSGRRWNEVFLTTLLGGGSIEADDDGDDEDDIGEHDEYEEYHEEEYLDEEQFP